MVVYAMFALTESLPAGGGGNPSEQNVSEAVDGRGRVHIEVLFYQEYKVHCCAYSFSRLRRQLPLGGSLSNLCEHSTYNRRARFENSVKLSRMKVFAELFSKSDHKS